MRVYAGLAAYFLVAFLFLKYAMPFLFPFVLAAFLAVLIDPAVSAMEARWRLPRSVGAALVILVLLTALTVLTVAGLSRLGAELVNLSASLPAVYGRLTEAASRAAEFMGRVSAGLPPVLRDALDRQTAGAVNSAQGLVQALLAWLQSVLGGLPGLLMIFLITGIATYLASRDKAVISRFLLAWTPPGWRRGVLSVKSDLTASTVGLIKAQFILVLLTFLVILAGLSWLGTPYALTLSVLSALLDVLPVLGPALVFVPWAAWAVITGEAGLAVFLLALYGAVALVRGVAQPYVIGERLGLHPLTVLLALYLGFRAFGPAGFVYGPLMAIVLKAAMAAGLLPSSPAGGGEEGAHRDG